jgi:hypothetical protein
LIVLYVFAIQQCAEGIVWIYLRETSPSIIAVGAKNLFLFFAFAFWPIWIPFALWLPENTQGRKQAMSVCFGIGSVLVSFFVLRIPDTTATACGYSIQYLSKWQSTSLGERVDLIAILFYGIAALLPFLISSLKNMWIVGVLGAIAGITIYCIEYFSFVSIWCFFSAVISLSLFYFLPKKKQSSY